jgi:hypothetical protein
VWKMEMILDVSHCTPWWIKRQEMFSCPVWDHPVNGILLFTLLSRNILFRLIVWTGPGSTGGGGGCSLILTGRSGSRRLVQLSSLLRAITLALGTQCQVCQCRTTGRGQLVGRELGLLGEVQANPGELREGRSRSGENRGRGLLLKHSHLDHLAFGFARRKQLFLLLLQSLRGKFLGVTGLFLLGCNKSLGSHNWLTILVLLSLSRSWLGGSSIASGVMSRRGEDILLGWFLKSGKILAVFQITRINERMEGRIVGHDGMGGWLLGGWLLADILFQIWVKRLSCGCVVVNSVPN